MIFEGFNQQNVDKHQKKEVFFVRWEYIWNTDNPNLTDLNSLQILMERWSNGV